MPTRVALVLARIPSFRPAVPLPSLRLPSTRALVAAAAVVGALALAYVAARETSLFAVRTIEITGAPASVAADARAALSEIEGTSLVRVDGGELERRLRQVPSIRAANVDRAFPHSLEVALRAERPLAVLREGERAWLVAESGRVIAEIEPRARRDLPRLSLGAGEAPERGGVLARTGTQAALAALRAVPARFPERVLSARTTSGDVTLVVRGWIQLRIGRGVELAAKLDAAAAVLRSLSADEQAGLAYVDVSLPRRPVAGPTDSQPGIDG